MSGEFHRSIEVSHLHAEDADINQKRSGELYKNIENNHLQAEGADTSREDQVDFTKL